jgi:TPR repeat protein
MRTDEPAEERLRQALSLIREKKDREAIELLRQLAAAGQPQAQLLLGWTYQLGRGQPVDKKMAERWYAAASEQDYPPAQFYLGALRQERGETKEALVMFERAAAREFPPACYRLALHYLKLPGYERKALSLLRLAKEQGSLPAAIRLSRVGLAGRLGLRACLRAIVDLPILTFRLFRLASSDPDDERLLH